MVRVNAKDIIINIKVSRNDVNMPNYNFSHTPRSGRNGSNALKQIDVKNNIFYILLLGL